MIVFQVSLNFDPVKEILSNAMSDLYFNEEGDYSRENASDNENLFTILQPSQFEPEQEKMCHINCRFIID